MSHRAFTSILALLACAAPFSPAAAQQDTPIAQSSVPEASREMLAKGMAMLDGEWSGNETTRPPSDAMTETTQTGTFESRMNHETFTATVNSDGQVFNVRLEDGALVYSAAGRPGEQRRRITRYFPVDANGDWYISVVYSAPLAAGKMHSVEEVYRMDGGVYTRTAQATPADGSGPPTLFRWGSFKKIGD